MFSEVLNNPLKVKYLNESSEQLTLKNPSNLQLGKIKCVKYYTYSQR